MRRGLRVGIAEWRRANARRRLAGLAAALGLLLTGCVTELDAGAAADCGGCPSGSVCTEGGCCLLETCDAHRREHGTFPDGCGGELTCVCAGGEREDPESSACFCTPGSCGNDRFCDVGSGSCADCECAEERCGSLSAECGSTACPAICHFPEACGGGAEPERCGCDGPDGTAPCDPPLARPYCWDVPQFWNAPFLALAELSNPERGDFVELFGILVSAEAGQRFVYLSGRFRREAARTFRVPLLDDGVSTPGPVEELPMLDRPGAGFQTVPRVRRDGLELFFVAGGEYPAASGEPPPPPPPRVLYHSFRPTVAAPWGESEPIVLPGLLHEPTSALLLPDGLTLLVSSATGSVGDPEEAGFYTTGEVRAFRRSSAEPAVTDFVDAGPVVLDDAGDNVADDEVRELTLGCKDDAILYAWRHRHPDAPGVVALGSPEPLPLGAAGQLEIAQLPGKPAGRFRVLSEDPECRLLYLHEEGGPDLRMVSYAERKHCGR